MDTEGDCLSCDSIQSTYLFSWHDSTTCYCQPYAELNSDGQCVCAEGYVQTSNLECVPCDDLQVKFFFNKPVFFECYFPSYSV